LQQVRTPQLIIQGTKDAVADISKTRETFEKMEMQNKQMVELGGTDCDHFMMNWDTSW